MTSKEINQYAIREYLAHLNIYPAKDKGYYGMYYSPFREDHNASMKVDYNKNLWFDYGIGLGGTLIDLVMRIENCYNGEAMKLLEKHISGLPSFSFHRNYDNYKPQIKQEPAINILNVTVLTNPALLQYLKERIINIEIAKEYCKEIHYSVNGKHYFAIGFQNNAGGYDLRNSYFKGCTNKDITTHSGNDKDICLVFEGYIDYLSFLSLKDFKSANQDIIVLNSVANLFKGMDFIQSHPKVYTYLDNDEAGKYATNQIKSACNSVVDQSPKYSEYKDLNDLLCGKKLTECKQGRLQESKLLGKEAGIQESLKASSQNLPKKKPGRRMKF